MRILDRYVLKNFLVPFLLCLFGFIAIWLVFDLGEHFSDFTDAKVSMRQVAFYYLTQLPATLIEALPVGVLLALLYALSRMSRTNEIISMLTAGHSIVRILLPLMGVGLVVTAICIVLNYQWAPHSEAMKRVLLDQIVRGKTKPDQIEGQLFRNRFDSRTWYVERIRTDLTELLGIHITQQDAQGNITRKYYAHRAKLGPSSTDAGKTVWKFTDAMVVNFDGQGNIADSKDYPLLEIPGWSETPWRVASSNMDPQGMSVPELRDYVTYNADFPPAQLAPFQTYLGHRWALPWACFVVVFIAAPLGIVYSRRGVLAGVASSIFIFFAMIFLRYLFLALGKGARIPPTVAAWAPNLLFAIVGLYLLWLRSNNRELPSPANLFRKKRSVAPTARLTPAISK